MKMDEQKPLSTPAQRALQEAEQRRKRLKQKKLAKEYYGRKGPEATRYGDWEKKGIISDF